MSTTFIQSPPLADQEVIYSRDLELNKFDPSKPLEEQGAVECFGIWFRDDDPVCMGDPNIPSRTPCMSCAECKIQTLEVLSRLDKIKNSNKSKAALNPVDITTLSEKAGTQITIKEILDIVKAKIPDAPIWNYHLDITSKSVARIYTSADEKNKKGTIVEFLMRPRENPPLLFISMRAEYEGYVTKSRTGFYSNGDWANRDYPSVEEMIRLLPGILSSYK